MKVLTALAEITVYSIILYLAILLFRMLFRRRMSAVLQYGLWFVLLLRLLVPVTIDSGIHLVTLQQNEKPVMQTLKAGNEPTVKSVGNLTAAHVSNNQPATGDHTNQAGGEGREQPAIQPAAQPVQAIPASRWIWDIGQILLSVWIAGMVVAFSWFTVLYMRLSASIGHSRRPLSTAGQNLYDKVKSDLGIGRGPKPVIVDGIASPALSINIVPKLLLPDGVKQGEGNLEHIFRHELTHYKRGDHIICLLLTVLRCVYWFNPAVWLAARQMQLDMEISCDSIAVRNMGIDGKRQYAATLLELFGQSGKAGPAMGMGMENNRTSAEKRIRGVFMSAKSNRTTRLAAILTALLLLATCFTTACQPTVAQTGSVNTAAPSTSPAAPPAESPSKTPTVSHIITSEPTLQPTPKPMPTPAPAPTVNPNLSKIQKKRQLIAGNIAAGSFTFAITKDRKVVMAGKNKDFGTFDTSKWSKIVAISAGFVHVVGLRANGTVIVAGSQRSYMNRYVKDWKKIVAVSACGNAVVMGLKSDGTVVSTGIDYNSSDPDKVKNWKNITAIAAGEGFGVGLKADGTVVATGNNEYGQCNVDDWKDIVAIAASTRTVLGLKADGTVVATGYNNGGECNVQSWRDIVAIAVGGYSSYGLKADGTVVSAGDGYLGQCNTKDWSGIIAISAGSGHVVGLKADGTMVAVGFNEEGACEVEGWEGIATVRINNLS